MSLRDELIQVAAVAVAAVEDIDHGSCDANRPGSILAVLSNIMDERMRQDKKWGPQHYDPRAWMTILGEEFGEACQEALRLTHSSVAAADAGKDVPDAKTTD